MSKDRRLGRGLEALLGQLPGWNSSAAPAQKPDAGAPGTAPAPLPFPDPYAASAAPFSGPSPVADAAPPMYTTQNPGQPVGEEAAWLAIVPQETEPAAGPLRLEIDCIESNPAQPRQEFDARDMQSLAQSIADHGLIQPVVVRRVEDRYQLVAGERRLRAAKQAGWTDVPVNIIEADDRMTAELAIVENMQRKDLNALEKAASFHRYIEQYGCTQEELAGRLKLDRSTIANLIRLLELPQPVQDAIRRNKITPGHARALLPLGDEREQVTFCERIQKEGINVRQTEAMVQDMIAVADQTPLTADQTPLSVVGRDGKKRRPRRGQSEHLAALEQEFRAALGTRVKLTHDAKGRGKLVINFQSHEEFERIRQMICEPGRPAAVG